MYLVECEVIEDGFFGVSRWRGFFGRILLGVNSLEGNID